MNRLTKQDAYWVGEEFWTSAEEPDDDEIDKVYMRLKAYEDTGLMPEEVEQMRDERCWVPLMERPPKDGQEVWSKESREWERYTDALPVEAWIA